MKRVSFHSGKMTQSFPRMRRLQTTWLRSAVAGIASVIAFSSAHAADTKAPSVPGNLVATAASSTQINVTWNASTDNVGVTGYQLDRCTGSGCTTFAQIATPTTTSFNDTGRAPSTTYRYRVRARDAVPNWSAFSSIVTRATPADTTAPSVPAGLTATPVSTTQINLSWGASTDNVAVTGYQVDRCTGASCTSFAQIATPTTTTFNDTGRTASTTYRYRVRARDAVPNWSAFATIVNATTLTPDTSAPSVPTGLTASPISATQVNLSWSASTDNFSVTGYQLDRCAGATCTTFIQIATPTTTSFSDTSLTASTTYRYRVRARDAVPNWSAFSGITNATTGAPPDTTAPTAPSSASATTVSSTQINVSWGISTDDFGVTAYLLERCQGAACSTFTQIASTTSLSYNDTSLTPATNYLYRVRATDAANNPSAYSNNAAAVTQYLGPITFSYTYDSLGRITHVGGSDGSAIDYQYDSNGNVTSINRH